MSQEELIRFALEELPAGPTQKPWMTASALANRIRQNRNVEVIEDELELALETEASKERGRRLRYSMYPSAKSLKTLWGAISAVKDRNLPNLISEIITGEDEVIENLEHVLPYVFVSHNFRDRQQVENLCDLFKDNNITTWIFESRIQEGEKIIQSVKDAIDSCPLCVLYLSKNSLGSTWVRKEILQTGNRTKIVVNGSDSDLCEYIGHVTQLFNDRQISARPEPTSDIFQNCSTGNQKNSANNMLNYVFDQFIKSNSPIYVHGSKPATNLRDTSALVESIQAEQKKESR